MSHKKKPQYVMYELTEKRKAKEGFNGYKIPYRSMNEGSVAITRKAVTEDGKEVETPWEDVKYVWEPWYMDESRFMQKLAVYYNKNGLSNLIDEMPTDEHTVLNNIITKSWNVESSYWRDGKIEPIYVGKVNCYGEITHLNKKEVTDLLLKYYTKTEAFRKNKPRKERKKNGCDYWYNRDAYEYRRDPVPYIHSYHSHRGSWYRHVALYSSELRKNFDPEIMEYVPAKRKPTSYPCWDDRPRHNDKSWKTSYSCKKQWEKNLSRQHVDTYKTNDTEKYVNNLGIEEINNSLENE